MGMHHVLIMLTLNFVHGHTDLNPESNKWSSISETAQAMPRQVCCEDSSNQSFYLWLEYILFRHDMILRG